MEKLCGEPRDPVEAILRLRVEQVERTQVCQPLQLPLGVDLERRRFGPRGQGIFQNRIHYWIL